MILLFEPILPRRFAERMRRRMEKNSELHSPIVREFGPIERVLSFDAEVMPPSDLSGRICVHFHLYYTDMAADFVSILNRLTIEYVLLVSIPEDEDDYFWQAYFKDRISLAQQVTVKRTVNKGRDVLPWLVDFSEEIQKYEIFCHLHTKQSQHNPKLEGWRSFLAHSMFGSEAVVNQILDLFKADQRLGLVFPPYWSGLGPRHVPPNWGDNKALAQEVITRLGFMGRVGDCPDFPAGSFFWARVSCLEPLFALGLLAADFEEEAGQLDGTLAHALERVVGALPGIAGMRKLCVTVDVEYRAAYTSPGGEATCPAQRGSGRRPSRVETPAASPERARLAALEFHGIRRPDRALISAN
jgi:lipopolysaccharide biosynthesis protein